MAEAIFDEDGCILLTTGECWHVVESHRASPRERLRIVRTVMSAVGADLPRRRRLRLFAMIVRDQLRPNSQACAYEKVS